MTNRDNAVKKKILTGRFTNQEQIDFSECIRDFSFIFFF